MIAQELEENIQFAFKDARDRKLEFVTIEHLLWVLLGTREVNGMMRDLSVDRAALSRDLQKFLASRVPRANQSDQDPRPTPSFQRVIRNAIAQAKHHQLDVVTAGNVINAMHDESESFGAIYLARRGATKLRVNAWLKRQREQLREEQVADGIAVAVEDELTRNLSAAAVEGRLDRPYRRDDIVGAVLRVLCRKYKSNPVLVGEPGVGKTAIVHTLAHHLSDGQQLPSALANITIHEASVAAMVAGTKYRGDFEARLKKLVEKMAASSGNLLFIDEIHTLIGAGSVSGGSLDAANILKPALAAGTMRCIGATTHAEYERVFARDAALSRRFQKIEVTEPSHQETVLILGEFRGRLQTHHGVTFGDEELDAAVRLADRYITQRCLPDKAIDLLDETCAAAALAGKPTRITSKHLDRTVARISGMSAEAVSRDDKKNLRRLERTLGKEVFGQSQAITELAAAVRRARLGMSEPGKPVGSFLFAGPTGVGKTETAKALAEALSVQLVRIDMSEHMERHSVSRLIGAPPGYVGFEQHGHLTEQIRRHPHCVLLLDEIEKAHPDVFNILLQIMDHGTLTDNAGNSADFRHAVLIMTTNAGADSWEKSPLGFAEDSASSEELGAIKRLFSPEFRNRLAGVIRFAPLSMAIAAKVVARELARLTSRLAGDRQLQLVVSPRMRKELVSKGFSKTLGARPLQRAITELVVDTLATADACGRLPDGCAVLIDCTTDGKPRLTVKEAQAA